MDPNVTLEEARRVAEQIRLERDQHGEDFTIADLGERLAELVEALNSWIMGGGFLPQAWELARHD